MQKNKIIIGLDFDGVIIDHTEAKLKKARELGYFLKPEQTHGSVMMDFVSREDHRAIQQYIYGSVTADAPIMEGALDTIKNLAEKYVLTIISRRTDDFKKYAIEWLENKSIFDYIPKERAFFASYDEEKNIIAKTNKVSCFVDDRIKYLEIMPDVPHKIVFDQFNMVNSNGFYKIKKWQELPAIIAELTISG